MRLKCYCKKDYNADSSIFNYKYRLISGCMYEYEIIGKNVIHVFNFNSVYYLYKNMNNEIFPEFNDYFYNEQEIRELKLNKINGIKNR